jgi:hypothetical protein
MVKTISAGDAPYVSNNPTQNDLWNKLYSLLQNFCQVFTDPFVDRSSPAAARNHRFTKISTDTKVLIAFIYCVFPYLISKKRELLIFFEKEYKEFENDFRQFNEMVHVPDSASTSTHTAPAKAPYGRLPLMLCGSDKALYIHALMLTDTSISLSISFLENYII